MKSFLHLTVFPNSSDYQESIEKELNRATDWIRYSPNCWLIYTSRTAQSWYKSLSAIPGIKDANLMLYEVNLSNRAGWIKRSVWDWITKER